MQMFLYKHNNEIKSIKIYNTERRGDFIMTNEFYTGLQAGYTRNQSQSPWLDTGAIVGGRVNLRGNYLQAEVGIGTALSGQIELGHTFDTGKKTELDLYANVKANRSNLKSEKHVNLSTAKTTVGIDSTLDVEQMRYNVDVQCSIPGDSLSSTMNYNQGQIRFGAGTRFKYKPSEKLSLSAGLEGGGIKSTSPESVCIIMTDSEAFTHVEKNSVKPYLTPTVSLDYQVSKHISMGVSADMYQGGISAKYNF